MRKNLKYITILIIAFLALGWGSFILNFGQEYAGYNKSVRMADKAFSKEIFIDAIDYYEEALRVKKSDAKVWLNLSESYYQLGETNKFILTIQNAIGELPQEQRLYVRLANHYIVRGDFAKMYKVLYSANQLKDRKEVDSLIKKYRNHYEVVGETYTDIKTWRDDYVCVKSGDFYGLSNDNGKLSLDFIYQNIGSFDSDIGVTPVQMDNKWYYVTSEGYKKLVGDHEYTYLGTFNNGYAPASYNGKYGWIDPSFKEYGFDYDYTTMFVDGVSAIKKGNKWALVNKKQKLITEFVYDDIKLDDNESIGNGEAIFVKQNNKYSLVNSDGEKIIDETFDDAKAFQGDQYAAVKKNGKWGYISTKGKRVIDYKYNDAKSFYNGVAGVSNGHNWGVISQDKKTVLDFTFQDVKSMSSKGVLIVKIGDLWQCIRIHSYSMSES